MFPNLPGDDQMEITITCVDSLSENAAKFFKNDGAFVMGVFKRVCEYVKSGITSGCLSPNPLLMTEYKDKIRHFKGSDNPWFGAKDDEMRVFDGLFDKAHEEDDSSCQICLKNSLYMLERVLREFKFFFLIAEPDLAGTIFDKGAYDKFWRDLWLDCPHRNLGQCDWPAGHHLARAPVIETLMMDGSRPGPERANGRQGTANSRDRGAELQK
jgi:hypothetical protein